METKTLTPQDSLLGALLDQDLNSFNHWLEHPEVNPSHKYGKPHYKTCLEIACRRPNCGEFVKALLNKVKPNINQIVPEPIHYAAGKGNLEALEVLLKDKRTKVNVEDSYGRTALHHAAKNFNEADSMRYEQCISLLLARTDLDVNRPNKKGITAIREAAHFGGKKAVQVMLKYGKQHFDLDSYLGLGKTAREFILEKFPELKGELPPPRSATKSRLEPHMQLLTALENRYLDVFCALLKQCDSDGNVLMDPNYWYGVPHNTTCLETACHEEGCEEFVEAALQAGADPNTVNLITGKSPIHIAVEIGNHEALKILVTDSRTHVNAIDKFGKTALHYSIGIVQNDELILKKWLKCLHILLDHPDLNINMLDNNGHSAILNAACCENKEAVEAMVMQKIHQLDLDTFQGLGNKTCRDIILEKFPLLRSHLSSSQAIHNKAPNVKLLLFEYLYKRHINEFVYLLTRQMKGDTPNTALLDYDDGSNSLLQYACKYGVVEVADLLLKYGANPNAMHDKNKTPPVVLATSNKHRDILVLFLKLPFETGFNINAVDMKGNSALHFAVWNKDLESTIRLIQGGAKLQLQNILGKPPFGMKDLKCLLDQCIKTNDRYPNEENYEMIFDYRLLTAYKSEIYSKKHKLLCKQTKKNGTAMRAASTNNEEEKFATIYLTICEESVEAKPEMTFLYYMSHSKANQQLLTHPVAASFLELKWNRVKWFSYTNVIFYILFLASLNLYIIPNHKMANADNIQACIIHAINWWSLIILMSILAIRELFQLIMSFQKYIKNVENIADICLIGLTATLLFACPHEMKARQIVTVSAILLSWMELVFMTGRVPKFSINIEMFKVVLKKYCFFSCTYFLLIIAFALCFHTLYRDDNGQENLNFNNFPMSLVQTLVMMTGEFNASDLSLGTMPIICTIVFALFVFLISIVLLNLLTGLTVSDTHAIQKQATLLALQTRIKVTLEIESILINFQNFVRPCIPKICVGLTRKFSRTNLYACRAPLKEGRVRPNGDGSIKLSFQEKGFKMKRDILDTAFKIINKGTASTDRFPENDNSRLEELEQSVRKILQAVKDIKIRLNIQDNGTDGPPLSP